MIKFQSNPTKDLVQDYIFSVANAGNTSALHRTINISACQWLEVVAHLSVPVISPFPVLLSVIDSTQFPSIHQMDPERLPFWPTATSETKSAKHIFIDI